jgi:hypothetical protein
MSQKAQHALKKMAASPAGRDWFRWLMGYCGYKHTSLTMTEEGVLLMDAIIHNEARRGLWLDIRRFIPAEFLNEIEMEEIKDVDSTPQAPQKSKS